MKIEWFVNGVAIKTGHRFKTTHDFGYVALDILYAYAEDSGTYMCKATNKKGETVNTCQINVSCELILFFSKFLYQSNNNTLIMIIIFIY